jgi:hypothetical protein
MLIHRATFGHTAARCGRLVAANSHVREVAALVSQ